VGVIRMLRDNSKELIDYRSNSKNNKRPRARILSTKEQYNNRY
jgi:hypothetical protein